MLNRDVPRSSRPSSSFAAAFGAFPVPPSYHPHSLSTIPSAVRLQPAPPTRFSSFFVVFFSSPLPSLFPLSLAGDVFAGWEILEAADGLLLPVVGGAIMSEVSAAMERSSGMRWLSVPGGNSVVFAAAATPYPQIAIPKVPMVKMRNLELGCQVGAHTPFCWTYFECVLLCHHLLPLFSLSLHFPPCLFFYEKAHF